MAAKRSKGKSRKTPRKRKKRVPPVHQPPVKGKQVRVAPESKVSIYDQSPAWKLQVVDREGPWGWDRCTRDEIESIAARLCDYEMLTWAAIDGQKSNHLTLRQRLIPEARRRLEAIGQDDVDELYQLRVDGPGRVWGIRDQHYLKILWWDPRHEVCPSPKKGT